MPEGGPGGATPWPGGHLARPGAGRAPWSPGQVGPAQVPYFAPIYPSHSENPLRGLLFHVFTTVPPHRDPEIGISRSSSPGTLPEGGLISGGSSITMIASVMLRE